MSFINHFPPPPPHAAAAYNHGQRPLMRDAMSMFLGHKVHHHGAFLMFLMFCER